MDANNAVLARGTKEHEKIRKGGKPPKSKNCSQKHIKSKS
jgi:hypothetical protein